LKLIVAALLADYWQKTVDKTVEKWRFSEVDASSVFNNFGGFFNTMATTTTHCLSTIHNHFCIVT
jgi:hypothetical protein